MWNRKSQPKQQQSSPTQPQPVISDLPNHNIQAYQLCTTKCLQSKYSKQPTTVEKSCFNRCIIKYTQALKFTIDYIKYQNHQLKKANQQHQRDMQGVNQQGILDKLYAVYNQHYGEGIGTGSGTKSKNQASSV